MFILPVTALASLYFLSLYFSKTGKKCAWIFPILHFTGGFFLAYLFSQYFENKTIIILSVLLVGLLWEVYEYMVNKIKFLKNIYKKYFKITNTSMTIKDTIFDLVIDVLGALFYILIYYGA